MDSVPTGGSPGVHTSPAGVDKGSLERRFPARCADAGTEREPLLGSGHDDKTPWARSTLVGAFGPGSQRRDNGRCITTILMINYMIGSGILNQPQVFSLSGIGAASALYLISGFAVWLGLVVLIEAAERASVIDMSNKPEDWGFAELAESTLGPSGSLAVDWSIVLTNFGDVCSYVVVIGSLTSSLLTEWTGGAGGAWTSFSTMATLMVVVFVLPSCLVRHFSHLRWIAGVSLAAVLLVAALVIVGGPIYAHSEGVFEEGSGVDTTLVWWDWTEVFSKLGSVVFAMSSAPAAFHAYTSMFPRNER
ncbi:unnamed protein product [Discosporangium mesarthrocarpum]